MNEEFQPVRSDDVVHFPAGHQICLHHLDSGEYFMLNGTGGFIWDHCSGELSVAGIATGMSESFEVDYHTALADTLEVVQTLVEQDCLVPASNPA